jgi:hypothetical protein
MKQYHERYLMGKRSGISGVLLSMAEKISLPPTHLARIILEQHVDDSQESSLKSQINLWIKNPASIPDKQLAEEVEQCAKNDLDFGPESVECRRQIGEKYEVLLREKLDSCDLCYIGQNDFA